MSKTCKELKQFNSTKQLSEKMTKELNKLFFFKTRQISNRFKKKKFL